MSFCEKEVTKIYLALSASPVPIGVITHYMRPVSIAPKLVSEEFTKGWYLCQLEVLECIEVPWPDTVTTEKYSVDDCGWPLQDYAYECKINLLTGRTYQDDESIAISEWIEQHGKEPKVAIALQACQISWDDDDDDDGNKKYNAGSPWWRRDV
ncbi:hypothetical protein M5689_012385 [Euphorbia peplus]|nr:hypothetical protein M5689_012385 [Euphorbia peplus]